MTSTGTREVDETSTKADPREALTLVPGDVLVISEG
jgi:hypothetical protein